MYTLGIDIGSSFIKAAVFSLKEKKIVFSKTAPSLKSKTHPYKYEILADDIFSHVKDIIDSAHKKYTLSGIFFATQMHGFVVKRPNCHDIYISWQDSRSTIPLNNGKNSIEQLGELISKEEILKTGVPLKPSLGICNLFALINQENLDPNTLTVYTLGSYLLYKLCGKNISHITNLAPLGIMDLSVHEINENLLKQAGLQQVTFPEVAKSDYEICGHYTIDGVDIPIFPDYGDHQVSVLGSQIPHNYVSINIATASQVSYVTQDFMPSTYEIRPYFYGKYLNSISNMPGGRNLAVLIKFISECCSKITDKNISESDVWRKLGENLEITHTNLTVDSLFYPTQAKIDGGNISNITHDNLNLNSLFSAMYNDMAETYKKQLPTITGNGSADGIVFSGGVSWKNPLLIDTVGKLIGLPYQKSPTENEVFEGLMELSLNAMEDTN